MIRSQISEIIADMLVEDTGTHFLDSGGVAGRAWQINRKKVGASGKTPLEYFRKTKPVEVDISEFHGKPDLLVTRNVFHVLTSYFDRDDICEQLEKEFFEFADRPENRDDYWLEVMEKWADEKGLEDIEHDNTYNWDSILSQDILYFRFRLPEDQKRDYVFIMIHGGADVRGGYTKPRLFVTEDFSGFVMDATSISVLCDKCNRWWEYPPSRFVEEESEFDKRRRQLCHKGCGGYLHVISE